MDATTIELPDPPIYAIGAELGRDRGSGISSEMRDRCTWECIARPRKFGPLSTDEVDGQGGIVPR
jgi:hypothetical protein